MIKLVQVVSLSLFALQFASCAKAKYAEPAPEQSASQSHEKTNTVVVTCPNVFESSQFCLDWYWENKPTSKSQGSIIFKTYRLNSFDQSMVPVELSTIPELILWMPGMGHGSTPTQVNRLDMGTYRAENIFFVMPGAWELRFQIKSEKKIVDKVYVAISI